MPNAFATVIDVPLASFLELVGHDGSEIVYPNLPSPMCHRGFHIQECVWPLFHMGYSITPIEVIPRHAPRYDLEPKQVLRGGSIGSAVKLFDTVVNNNRGVLVGRGLGFHAVAFDHGMIYDSCQPEPYQYDDLMPNDFTPTCAWVIRRSDETNE